MFVSCIFSSVFSVHTLCKSYILCQVTESRLKDFIYVRRRSFPDSFPPSGEPWHAGDSEQQGPVLLPAFRGYDARKKKVVGCMADGLHCNIWERAQSPAKLSYNVINGHSVGVPGSRRGSSVLAIDVLKWRPGRPGNLPKPPVRVKFPILDQLGPKIAHFLVDYHARWFPSLALPPSTGRHDQLDGAHLDAIIDRLQQVGQLLGEVQLFTGFKIGHGEFQGCQTIHCTPFPDLHSKPRMVSAYIYIKVHQLKHMHIYVHILHYTYIY